MFFVIDKARLQRTISVARDDRRPAQQGDAGPFFRIEANGDQIKLTGREVEAKIPATVYEPGVLFLRVTLFRRLLRHTAETKSLALQAEQSGLHFGGVTMPLEPSNMLLYVDPAKAPARHPDEDDESEQERDDGQASLF